MKTKILAALLAVNLIHAQAADKVAGVMLENAVAVAKVAETPEPSSDAPATPCPPPFLS